MLHIMSQSEHRPKQLSSNCLVLVQNPKFSQFTVKYNKEMRQIITFEKVEPEKVTEMIPRLTKY